MTGSKRRRTNRQDVINTASAAPADQPGDAQPCPTPVHPLTGSPYAQRPGEPPRWYARFDMYRLLGPKRSIEAAFRIAAEAEGLKGERAGSIWHTTAREWEWEARATAWDEEQRTQFRAYHKHAQIDRLKRRLAMIDEVLAAAFRMLALANLPQMDQAEARKWLPIARLLFRDMLQFERTELGMPDMQDEGEAGLHYTADDLRQAQLELEQWRQDERVNGCDGERVNGVAPQAADGSKRARRTLLVAVGPDAALMVDLAGLRMVKAATGLNFHRILDVTRDEFDAYLRRERSKGRPVELLHLAVHAAHDGLQFGDGMVTGDWLSERLLGVRVMLLAGCQGDRVGDWLGVVPYVVTLAEDVTHEDAALLTQHFWMGIGRGLAPDQALDDALAHCAPVVSEYVIRHW